MGFPYCIISGNVTFTLNKCYVYNTKKTILGLVGLSELF